MMYPNAIEVRRRSLEKGISLDSASRELSKEYLLLNLEKAESLNDLKDILREVINDSRD